MREQLRTLRKPLGNKDILRSRQHKEATMEKNNQKKEIKVKESPHAKALKNAPDEALARAIHDALLKEHERKGSKLN